MIRCVEPVYRWYHGWISTCFLQVFTGRDGFVAVRRLCVGKNVKNSIAKERQAYLQLHACVVLWGFTAILGRLISLPAVQLVHWRMALVAVVLLALRRTWVGVAVMPPLRFHIYGNRINCCIALGGLLYIYQNLDASVAVACLGLGSIFAAIIEPIVIRDVMIALNFSLAYLRYPVSC